MVSTSELWVLNKINDLASRCGVDPLSAEFYLSYNPDPSDGRGGYQLGGVDNGHTDDKERANLEKFHRLLGLGADLTRRFEYLSELNRTIDQALSLAPRSRIR